ncbi:MAG: hypothetical protein HZB61_00395 [Nitrospirae bacterium]|nr:hypothetical protein [Nitrospirota bacterium]
MEELSVVSGLILVVASIIANAYWQDTVRWDSERRIASRAKKPIHTSYAKKCKRNATLLFRFSVFLGLCSILPIFLYLIDYTVAALYILGLAISAVTLALAYFTVTPKYLVPTGYPEDFDDIEK